ncbi:MAG: Gfo/Idh/MocA family oxidoreductase [Planctomycetes bacterium]|nr:Gfo/Idh/MocA family oxidoreductase [Planctomycetota bacterium]
MNTLPASAPRVAVIGFGQWGKNLIRNFHELGVLSAICDSDPSRREKVREQYPGVDYVEQVGNLLRRDDIDAVVIATPAVTHFEIARRAIQADKDVYVEKPLALDPEEGETLVRLADQASRILMVGHILQYHPAVVALKEMMRSGDLGRIEYIYSNRLNIGKFRTEENILWSFAPHDISVILALLDEEPCQVFARGGDYLSDNVADVTMSHFVFPSGTQAHIFVSWLHPFKEQRLVVVGSKKMVVFEDTAEDKLLVYPHEVQWINRIPKAVKAESQVVDLLRAEPLRVECQHFLESVRKRTCPVTDGKEGLRVLRVLADCQRAMEANLGDHSRRPARRVCRDTTFFAHATASIDEECDIGAKTKIWHYSHIMRDVRIGADCVVGQNCCVSPKVSIGNRVKIQNNVSIYTGVSIEDDVFLGPSCVFTNVSNPRSQVNRRSLYETTVVRRGATIGANATVVCGVEIGRYAFVGAGAVVTKSVPEYALVMGNPAREVAWMSRHGHQLSAPDADGIMVCPESGLRYSFSKPGVLRCLDLDEDAPLPEKYAIGHRSYRSLRDSSDAPESTEKTALPVTDE